MTPAEAQVLLSMAAAYDNRKPDPDAAKAWARAFDGLRFEDCRDALVQHYIESNDWLMPSHIVTRVKRVRAKRIAETPLPEPPSGLTGAEYVAWKGRATRAIGDGQVPPPAPELPRRPMKALLAGVDRKGARS